MTEPRCERYELAPSQLETDAKWQTHRKHLGKGPHPILSPAKRALTKLVKPHAVAKRTKKCFFGERAGGKGLPPFR